MNNVLHLKHGQSLPGKFKFCAVQFINLSVALLIALFAVRILEIIYIFRTNNLPLDFWNVIGQALVFDVLSFLQMLPFLFIPFLMINLMSGSMKLSYRTYVAGGSIGIIIYALLVKYFATAGVPLAADLFGYSMKDIEITLRGSTSMDAFSIFLFIIPLSLFWVALTFLIPRNGLKPSYALVILGTGTALVFTVPALPSAASFETEFSYNLALNKMTFFAGESYAYFTRSAKDEVHAMIPHNDGNPGHAQVFQYVSPEHPFLRTEDTPDVLGSFFNVTADKPPNIVSILVEVLGKAFSGPNAYLGSFTPFLDDLAATSLYWENFLS